MVRCAYNLHERQRYVEVRGEVGVPDDAHIGEEEGSQVPLLGGEVPDAADLGEDLLLGQQDQLAVLHDRPAQLQVAV
jgi:hypothetical protein